MNFRVFSSVLPVVVLFALSLVGCASPERPVFGPPEGWQGTSGLWWQAGVDTARAFRDLESLAAMGVSDTEVTYVASTQVAQMGRSYQQLFERSVRESLEPLYRNEPELVDSLFQQHVMPLLADAVETGNLQPQVEQFKKKAYTLLRKHFQEPQMALQIGEDVPVPFPDSLREAGVAGTVRTQVYLNADGEPVAVKLLDSVHPVLDDIAMRATTHMRWRPAYRMRKGNWVAIPAWVRFGVRFHVPG